MAGSRLCASACATVVGCPTDESAGLSEGQRAHLDRSTDTQHAACVAACLTAASSAEVARCTAEHHAYLACVSRQTAVCSGGAAAPGAALENALGISGCAGEHAAYFRCSAVCRDRGAVWTRSLRVARGGREREIAAELIPNGCSTKLPSPHDKSPAGAPCTHHSVCSSALCDCPASGVRFLARACDDGRCADGRAACALAPEVVGHDPCPGRDPSVTAP